MKSSLIANAEYITNKHYYSDMMVCKSAAGYYIGTMYTSPEGFLAPGGRDSVEYYPTEGAAQHALDNNLFTQRTRP